MSVGCERRRFVGDTRESKEKNTPAERREKLLLTLRVENDMIDEAEGVGWHLDGCVEIAPGSNGLVKLSFDGGTALLAQGLEGHHHVGISEPGSMGKR